MDSKEGRRTTEMSDDSILGEAECAEYEEWNNAHRPAGCIAARHRARHDSIAAAVLDVGVLKLEERISMGDCASIMKKN